MGYLSADAIEATLTALATTYPTLCVKTPFVAKAVSADAPPREYSYLRIGHGGPGRPVALLVAGIHARELAQPDAVLSLIAKLLRAYTAGTPFIIDAWTDAAAVPPLTYGPGPPISAADVKRIVENVDWYVLPLANPAGRQYCIDNAADPLKVLWRKNRSQPAPPVGVDDPRIGVDVNRNFDIAWLYKEKYYNDAALADPKLSISDSASSEVYRGPAVFSEVESKNVQLLRDTCRPSFYIDAHSYSPQIAYPWGIETEQTADNTKTFSQAAWDRGGAHNGRDGLTGTVYEEFIPNSPVRLRDEHVAVGNAMSEAIRLAAGAAPRAIANSTYPVAPSIGMYPAPGASDDYTFSRAYLSAAPTVVFTVEFGSLADGAFQPIYTTQFRKVEREVHAALLGWLKYIAMWRGFAPAAAATGTGTRGSSGSGGLCSFSIAFESDLHPEVVFVRRWRDGLERRPVARRFVPALEALYTA